MNRLLDSLVCCALILSATTAASAADSSYDVKSGGFNREEIKQSFFPKDEKGGHTAETDKLGENPYSDFAQRERTQPEPEDNAEQAPPADEFEVKPDSRASR